MEVHPDWRIKRLLKLASQARATVIQAEICHTPVVHYWEQFCSPREYIFGNVWIHFWLSQWTFYWHLLARGQGCSYTYYSAQSYPTNPDAPIPNASSAAAEKPHHRQGTEVWGQVNWRPAGVRYCWLGFIGACLHLPPRPGPRLSDKCQMNE